MEERKPRVTVTRVPHEAEFAFASADFHFTVHCPVLLDTHHHSLSHSHVAMSDTTSQDPTAPLPITTALRPFDKVNADIVLRTSDNVDFHVYSQILIAASPFFEAMFDVPQPPLDQQQLKNGRPIINVSETSKALYPLLRICYPINKPENRSLEEVELSLAAALKFEMELPITVLTNDLESFASSHPLKVWGIACRLRLESVAKYAAKCAAKDTPLARPDFTVLGDMRGISAADYFRLREYCRLRRKTPKGFKLLSPASLPKPSPVIPSTLSTLSRVDAPPPDIVCRSADGVEFPAHRTLISLASATLMARVSAVNSPRPEEGSPGGLAPLAVQFEEVSVVLQALLQLCYHSPTDITLPTDLADLTAVLVATEKYELQSAQSAVWSFWQAIASQSPLRAYCYAIRAGHTVGAKEAARCTLNHVIEGVYVEELECTPALAYHRLLTYYDQCRTATKEELAKIITSLKGTITAPIATSPPSDTLNSMSCRPEGGLPAAKKPRKMKAPSSDNLVPDGPWLLRHLHGLSSRVQERPGSAMPGLEDLFIEATKAWSDGKMPRMWCEGCQVLAEEILEVNKGLQQLPNGLSKVSGFVRCILWCPTVLLCDTQRRIVVLRSSLRFETRRSGSKTASPSA